MTRLSKVLNYELSSSVLFLLAFVSVFAIPLLMLAAIVFTPIMLFDLYKSNKKGWIAAFVVIVIVPLLIILIIGMNSGDIKTFLFIPLAPFYLYTFLLKLSVNERVQELKAREQYEKEKLLRKQELQEWEKQLNKNPDE
ncbi:MAG: hypothetical protein WC061_08295 [Melioribacteraceae bacterium]